MFVHYDLHISSAQMDSGVPLITSSNQFRDVFLNAKYVKI